MLELVGSTAEDAMGSIRRVGDRAGILEVVCAAERVALTHGCLQSSAIQALALIRSTVMTA